MMRASSPWRNRSAALAVIAALILPAIAAAKPAPSTAHLQPPPGYFRAAGGKPGGSADCPSPPAPFTGTLEFQSKYEGSGASRDEVNPEAEAAYKQKTQPITAFEKGSIALVKKYMRSGQPAELQCVIGWLTRWADAGALLGEATNHTGRSLRKWSLATLASGYVRLKFSSSVPLKNYPGESKRIETWFSAIADHVVAEWPPTDPIEKINNHYYWAAWALMATSVATDRHALFDHSLVLFRIFEQQIDADGHLPNEMKRATRAADYHNYAMAPLAMIAAFAKANGVDLAAEGNHALSRLAQASEQALADPSSFAEKAGATQDTGGLESKTARAWMEPYCWTVRCTDRELSALRAARPLASTRLGGELTAIFANDHADTPHGDDP